MNAKSKCCHNRKNKLKFMKFRRIKFNILLVGTPSQLHK